MIWLLIFREDRQKQADKEDEKLKKMEEQENRIKILETYNAVMLKVHIHSFITIEIPFHIHAYIVFKFIFTFCISEKKPNYNLISKK
jgi:hypothetical protein